MKTELHTKIPNLIPAILKAALDGTNSHDIQFVSMNLVKDYVDKNIQLTDTDRNIIYTQLDLASRVCCSINDVYLLNMNNKHIGKARIEQLVELLAYNDYMLQDSLKLSQRISEADSKFPFNYVFENYLKTFGRFCALAIEFLDYHKDNVRKKILINDMTNHYNAMKEAVNSK